MQTRSNNGRYTRMYARSVVCMFVVFLLSACDLPFGIPIDIQLPGWLQGETTSAINTLKGSIDELTANSASWQTILQETIAKLTKDGQTTIANEVQNAFNRGIATGGVEFRCDADFVGNRVREDLARILAKLQGTASADPEPMYCQVVPLAVDMNLDPSRRNVITVYGYNFDSSPSVQLFLQEGDHLTDMTVKALDRQTHYHMTVNLGGNGIPLSPASNRLILKWKEKELSSIPIIQPTVATCQTQPSTIPLDQSLTYIPPHVAGDTEFMGHGPAITARVTLENQGTSLAASVFMDAKETQGDWTEASGSQTFTIYNAPAGKRILSIIGPTESTRSYVASNTGLKDYFNQGPGEPVKQFVFTADTGGSEAGTRTSVEVIFNAIQVVLIDTSNCQLPPPNINTGGSSTDQ